MLPTPAGKLAAKPASSCCSLLDAASEEDVEDADPAAEEEEEEEGTWALVPVLVQTVVSVDDAVAVDAVVEKIDRRIDSLLFMSVVSMERDRDRKDR